jgi:ribonuclease HI
MNKIICYVHGLATSNPGPAAIGVSIVADTNETLATCSYSIGNAYATGASYQAVMVALDTLSQIEGISFSQIHVEVRSDNESVVAELRGTRAVTDPGNVPLYMAIHNLYVTTFPHISFVVFKKLHKNPAVALVEQALDVKK